MAIKVNLQPREAVPARAGISISAPRLAIGGGVAVKVATGVLVLVILGLGVTGYTAWSAKAGFAKEITELNAENERLRSQLNELRVAEEAKRDIRRRLDIIGRVAKSQGVPVAVMTGVLNAVPQGIWLTSFEMKPQEVKVKVDAARPLTTTGDVIQRLEAKQQEVAAPSGQAGAKPEAKPKPETREVIEIQGYTVLLKGAAFNNFQIADFMENLRKVGVFADVDFVITQADRLEQTRVVNFEVTGLVKL